MVYGDLLREAAQYREGGNPLTDVEVAGDIRADLTNHASDLASWNERQRGLHLVEATRLQYVGERDAGGGNLHNNFAGAGDRFGDLVDRDGGWAVKAADLRGFHR
jgi:hypothetical protein